MKILHQLPPIWDQVNEAGMHPNPDTVVFTYGDTIYIPSGRELPEHLIEHEQTHSKQQGNDPDAWWARYMKDPYFRISQEVEAYANQYRFISKTVKDKNQRFKFLYRLSQDLASPMYGSVILQSRAFSMIKEKSGVKP